MYTRLQCLGLTGAFVFNLQKKENRVLLSNYLKIIRKTMRTPERTEKKSEGTDQIQISTQKGNTQKTLLLTLQEKPLWEMHRIRNNDQIFMIKGQIPLIDYGKTITH